MFQLALLYGTLYLCLVTVCTLSVRSRYSRLNSTDRHRLSNGNMEAWLLALFLSLAIGFRPFPQIFGDTFYYIHNYQLFEGSPFVFKTDTENFLFDNLLSWFASMKWGYTALLVLLSFIYFMTSYWGIRRLFPNDTLAAYLVFLGAFSTFSYSTNGLKAGAAASLFIWALSYRQSLPICILLMGVSLGFHHSMQVPIAAFCLTLFFKSSKYYFYGWFFCLLMALLHVGYFQNLFMGLTDQSGAGYLSGKETEGIQMDAGGFRPDFILYSAMPVLVGYYTVIKRQIQTSGMYRTLLHLYLTTNGAWMLCMYASFTNRIAYLSWFLYPIVLIYPFLNEDLGTDRYRQFSRVMLYHLGFKIFMSFIYY